VDEVQDLSPLQLKLITALVPEDGQGAFAIGDPNQSIYGFRGAVTHIRDELQKHWPEMQGVDLDQNYRSRQNLLDFIHPLMPDSRPLKANLAGQGSLVSYQSRTGEQEAQWTAERIRDLIGGTAHRDADLGRGGELAPGDIAVLVRFKGLMPPFERALTRLGIPCTVPEAAPFWQEPRIELILNTVSRFLGIAPDPGIEILDCPDRILAEGPERIAAYFQNVKPFDSIFWKSQPFQELKKAYARHEGWANLVSWTRLESELSRVREKADKVRILTLHAAKGLEFEAVFVPALEEGILPFAGRSFLSGRPQEDEDRPDLDEEQRLMYVGLTRARQHLFLSSAASRRMYGRSYQLKPSSFLQALPLDMTRRIRSVPQKKQKQRQLKLL
jgi:superfamily I DNA/RNA helicase